MSKCTLLYLECDAPGCKVRFPGTSKEGWGLLTFRAVQNSWRQVTYASSPGRAQRTRDFCPTHTDLA